MGNSVEYPGLLAQLNLRTHYIFPLVLKEIDGVFSVQLDFDKNSLANIPTRFSSHHLGKNEDD